MKKLDKHTITNDQRDKQEKISDLCDDLLTALEGHMDEMSVDEVFYNSIVFMIKALYECTETHKEALKILRMACDDAIRTHIKERQG